MLFDVLAAPLLQAYNYLVKILARRTVALKAFKKGLG